MIQLNQFNKQKLKSYKSYLNKHQSRIKNLVKVLLKDSILILLIKISYKFKPIVKLL